MPPFRKVALFTDHFSVGTFRNIGTALARGFQEAGVACDLVVLDTEPALAARYPDVTVVSLGAPRAIRSLGPLTAYLNRARPEVLFAMPWYFNVLAIWARRLAGIPAKVIPVEQNIISLEAHIEHRFSPRMRLVPPLMRLSYPFANGLIGVAAEVLTDLREEMRIGRSLPTAVVPNPIDLPEVRRRAAEPPDAGPGGMLTAWADGAARGGPLILTVARLARQKRLDVLLQAFARVRARVSDARLLILGEGVLRADLEQQARDLGVADAVRMPGYLVNPCPWMARCDVFVLASAWEGCPVALEEAMGCGAAVVVNDAPGGSKDIVAHGQHGLMVPAGDPVALGEALLEPLLDPARRDDLRARAAARAADFHFSAVARRYLDFAASV